MPFLDTLAGVSVSPLFGEGEGLPRFLSLYPSPISVGSGVSGTCERGGISPQQKVRFTHDGIVA